MSNFLFNYGLFLAKSVTFVAVILVILAAIAALLARRKQKEEGMIEVKDLSEKYEDIKNELKALTLPEAEYKKFVKEQKKLHKKRAKEEDTKRRIFVIDFEGDIEAHQVEPLREVISAILTIATPEDEVFIKIDSPGGVVHTYGLAASQLHRLRKKHIPLTVSIDKVAASGGYLMAAVANRIIAAPFAIVGSIGVIAELPNFHRLMKKHDIEYEQVTAGQYKRTLTMFGENTNQARAKLKEEIEQIHDLFKDYLITHRPQLDLNKVATGEYWLATQAEKLALVDEIMTSDEYLMSQLETANIFAVSYSHKRSFSERIEQLVHKDIFSGLYRSVTKSLFFK